VVLQGKIGGTKEAGKTAPKKGGTEIHDGGWGEREREGGGNVTRSWKKVLKISRGRCGSVVVGEAFSLRRSCKGERIQCFLGRGWEGGVDLWRGGKKGAPSEKGRPRYYVLMRWKARSKWGLGEKGGSLVGWERGIGKRGFFASGQK